MGKIDKEEDERKTENEEYLQNGIEIPGVRNEVTEHWTFDPNESKTVVTPDVFGN